MKESVGNGIYKQEINTFIRTLSNDLITWLRYAVHGRYIVVFRTMNNKHFTFGSDGEQNFRIQDKPDKLANRTV